MNTGPSEEKSINHKETSSDSKRMCRWLCRASISVVVFIFLLPSLIPESMLRRWVRQDLQSRTGCQVELADVSVSWFSGIRLSKLTMDKSDGEKLFINRMQIPFEPINLVSGKPISHIHIEGVNVSLPEKGELPRMSEILGTEDLKIPVSRIFISDVNVSLNQKNGFQNNFIFPKLELIINNSTGTIDYTTNLRLESKQPGMCAAKNTGLINSNGKLKIVKQGGQQCFAGLMHIQWQKVDLGGWQFDRLDGIDLDKLTGVLNGSLDFEIFPDFRFRWRFDTTCDNLVLRQKTRVTPARINHLSVKTDGNYDPVSGRFEVSMFMLENPSLSFDSKIIGQIGDSDLVVNLLNMESNFDSSVLPGLWPGMNDLLGKDAEINGPCRFKLQWKHEPVGYTLLTFLSADQVGIDHSRAVYKNTGEPLNAQLALHADQKNWPMMTIDRFDVNTGPLTIRGSGQLPVVHMNDNLSWWLDEVRRQGKFTISLKTEAVQSIGQYILASKPVLEKINLTGPLSIQLGYTGGNNEGQVTINTSLAKGSTLAWADYFKKPTADMCSFVLTGRIPWQIDNSKLAVDLCGQCGRVKIQTSNSPINLIWSFSEKSDGRTHVDLFSEAAIETSGLDELLSCIPRLNGSKHTIDLSGKTTFHVGAAIEADQGPMGWQLEQARVFYDLVADDTRLIVPNIFTKKEGVTLASSMDYYYSNPDSRQELDGVFEWQDVVSKLKVVRQGVQNPKVNGHYEIDIQQLSKAIASIPVIAEYLKDHVKLDGHIKGIWRWFSDRNDSKIRWNLDATGTDLMIEGQKVKPEGMKAFLTGEIELPEMNGQEGKDYSISHARLQIGQSYIDLQNGLVEIEKGLDNDWLDLIGIEPWIAWQRVPVESFNLNLTGRIDSDCSFLAISPKLSTFKKQYHLTGPVEFTIDSKLNNSLLQTRISTRLDRLEVESEDDFHKNAGLNGRLDLTLNSWPDFTKNGTYYCQLSPVRMTLGSILVRGDGYAEISADQMQNPVLNNGLLSMKVQADMSDLHELLPAAARNSTGKIFADLTVKHDQGKTLLGSSSVHFDKFHTQLSDQPMSIDGSVRFSSDYVDLDHLAFSIGISSLNANGLALIENGGVNGTVLVRTDHFDVDQVRAVFEPLFDDEPTAPKTVPLCTTRPSLFADTDKQEKLMAAFQPIRKVLSASNFLLDFDALWLQATDPRNNLRYQLRDFRFQMNIGQDTENHRPKADFRFWNRVSDGLTYGNFIAWLDEENPSLELTSSIDNIRMTEAFCPMVEDFFPGLKVENRITINEKAEQKMFTTRKTAPNYPVGYGNMIFDEGYMEGRAAPAWVVQLFPGLNLTRYKFSKMHNWFSKKNNGVVHNNMIFVGSPWNVYIEGDSMPDGNIIYEVGVDVLARYESEYWSSLGQGRVPIFITTAKIVKGKMENQQVKYVPPHEVIYRILVKNNAITGAYRLLMKNRP